MRCLSLARVFHSVSGARCLYSVVASLLLTLFSGEKECALLDWHWMQVWAIAFTRKTSGADGERQSVLSILREKRFRPFRRRPAILDDIRF